MCIYCGSEDDELVIDTERPSEGKNLHPRCQSCVESGKPRLACGKRAFDERTDNDDNDEECEAI
jgi:hypothetical protein